jgi:hypothetical protein
MGFFQQGWIQDNTHLAGCLSQFMLMRTPKSKLSEIKGSAAAFSCGFAGGAPDW